MNLGLLVTAFVATWLLVGLALATGLGPVLRRGKEDLGDQAARATERAQVGSRPLAWILPGSVVVAVLASSTGFAAAGVLPTPMQGVARTVLGSVGLQVPRGSAAPDRPQQPRVPSAPDEADESESGSPDGGSQYGGINERDEPDGGSPREPGRVDGDTATEPRPAEAGGRADVPATSLPTTVPPTTVPPTTLPPEGVVPTAPSSQPTVPAPPDRPQPTIPAPPNRPQPTIPAPPDRPRPTTPAPPNRPTIPPVTIPPTTVPPATVPPPTIPPADDDLLDGDDLLGSPLPGGLP